MKIQFGDKGRVTWDALLEALDREDLYSRQSEQQEDCGESCYRRWVAYVPVSNK